MDRVSRSRLCNGPLWRALRWSTVSLALFWSFGAAAQQPTAGQLKALDSTYQQLLENPSDIALNRRLIEIALQIPDYDAAIGAIERLIFYDPENPALHLEAARYYYAIQSYAAARGYAEDGLALPAATGQVRSDLRTLLADIAKATKPSIWSGLAQVGVRYQSNANIGPYNLESEFFTVEPPTDDWNAFALGTLVMTNPINEYLVIEGSMSGYYADQYKVHRLDLGFAELRLGPRFVSSKQVSFKPYGITQGFILGSDPYLVTYGGGMVLTLALADKFTVEPQFEYKDRTFYDSDDYPDATDLTGAQYTYGLNFYGGLTQSTTFRGFQNASWRARLAINELDASVDYQSYNQYLAAVSVRMEDIFGWDGWDVTPFGSVFWADYGGVAPQDALTGIVREDFQWNVGANVEVQILEHLSLGAQVQYTENESNLNRFSYRNFQALVGPVARF